MPQADSHNTTAFRRLNRGAYEQEAIATIAALFWPHAAPPASANTTPPACLLVRLAADAGRVVTVPELRWEHRDHHSYALPEVRQ